MMMLLICYSCMQIFVYCYPQFSWFYTVAVFYVMEPCQKCLNLVRYKDNWMTIKARLYHVECFICFRCKKSLTKDTWTQNKYNKLICKDCEKEIEIYDRPIFSLPIPVVCNRCEQKIDGPAMKLNDEQHYYCINCFTCHACGNSIKGKGPYVAYELIDLLFCVNCYEEYKNAKYLQSVMGCGPPGIPTLTLTQVRKYTGKIIKEN